jgi:hypothetical protein
VHGRGANLQAPPGKKTLHRFDDRFLQTSTTNKTASIPLLPSRISLHFATKIPTHGELNFQSIRQ